MKLYYCNPSYTPIVDATHLSHRLPSRAADSAAVDSAVGYVTVFCLCLSDSGRDYSLHPYRRFLRNSEVRRILAREASDGD